MLLRLFATLSCSLLMLQCSLLEDARTRRMGPSVEDKAFRSRATDDESGMRRRVIILPFLNLSPYASESASEIAKEEFIRHLTFSNEVISISSDDLGADINSYQVGDGYDIKKLLPQARKIGAHAILVGRIREVRTRKIGDSVGVIRKVRAEVKTRVDVEMYSLKDGESMAKETRGAVVEEEVTRVAQSSYTDRELRDNPDLVRAVVKVAFKKMVQPILMVLRKMSWNGRVALVRGERVYLNAGRLSGLQVGDILRVTESKEEVFDPETGGYLGNITGRMKGTVEVISYFGKDGAVTVVHSGSGFQENDIVEFY